MKLASINYTLIILLLSNYFCYAQNNVPQDQIKAKIDIERTENSIKITGTAENLIDITKSASYTLSVIKNSMSTKNNKSNNVQEGLLTLEPGEKIKLSSTQVNINEDDEIIIMLLFFNEEMQVISKERLVFNNDKKKNNTQINPPDGNFILKGIVTDNTKTKIGKDYYDKYYYYYNDIGINGNEIVFINEELSFGRNIRISLEINNEIIYEFMARPDDEFLDAVATESAKITYFYFKEKEKQRKYFTQY